MRRVLATALLTPALIGGASLPAAASTPASQVQHESFNDCEVIGPDTTVCQSGTFRFQVVESRGSALVKITQTFAFTITEAGQVVLIESVTSRFHVMTRNGETQQVKSVSTAYDGQCTGTETFHVQNGKVVFDGFDLVCSDVV